MEPEAEKEPIRLVFPAHFVLVFHVISSFVPFFHFFVAFSFLPSHLFYFFSFIFCSACFTLRLSQSEPLREYHIRFLPLSFISSLRLSFYISFPHAGFNQSYRQALEAHQDTAAETPRARRQRSQRQSERERITRGTVSVLSNGVGNSGCGSGHVWCNRRVRIGRRHPLSTETQPSPGTYPLRYILRHDALLSLKPCAMGQDVQRECKEIVGQTETKGHTNMADDQANITD